MRIVSLSPSATELICAAKGEAFLVGRSHECDFPFAIRSLPVCTSSRVNLTGTSKEIDEAVRDAEEDKINLIDVDVARLRGLNPDLIFFHDETGVASIKNEDLLRQLNEYPEFKSKLVPLTFQRLDDLWANLKLVGEKINTEEKTAEVIRRLKSHVQAVESGIHAAESRPSVLVLSWIDPLLVDGSWIPPFVQQAGGDSLVGGGDHYPGVLEYEKLLHLNPEILIFISTGFNIERARNELDPITTRPGWYDLTAVQNNRVFIVNGQSYFSRFSPRIVASLEVMAEIMHPEIFDYGHKLEGWQYWGFDRVA